MWGGHNLCCNASGCAGWDPRPWHLHGCPQGAGTTHGCPLQLGLPPKSRGWGSAQWVRQFSSSLITSLLGCFAEKTLHTGKLMLSPGQRWSRLPRHLTSQPWPGHSTHREGAVGGEAVSWNEKCTRSSLVIFLTKFAVSCLNAGVRHRHLLADLRSAAAILRAGGATPGQLQRGQTTSSQHWETSPVRGEICVPSPWTQGAGNKHNVVNAAGGRAQSRFGGRQGRCHCLHWNPAACDNLVHVPLIFILFQFIHFPDFWVIEFVHEFNRQYHVHCKYENSAEQIAVVRDCWYNANMLIAAGVSAREKSRNYHFEKCFFIFFPPHVIYSAQITDENC